MDNDHMRERLAQIVSRTAGAFIGARWGDNLSDAGSAAAWQYRDDLAAGRIDWSSAHRAAKRGLALLDAGDDRQAEMRLWLATDLLMAALERGAHMKAPAPAGRRGRPKSKDMDQLASAVKATGLTGVGGIRAAIRAEPDLRRLLKNSTDAALAEALRRRKGK